MRRCHLVKFIVFILISTSVFSCHSKKESRTIEKKKEFDQHFYQAQKEKAAGLNQEAILSFEKSLAFGNDPVVHYEIAKLILEETVNDFGTFRSIQDAFDHIQLAIKQDGKNVWYQTLAGEIAWAMGRETDALAYFSRAINFSENKIYTAEMQMNWYNGFPKEGLAIIKELEKEHPLSVGLVQHKVEFLSILGNYKEASNDLIAFEKANKPDLEFYISGMEVIRQSGEMDKIEYWQNEIFNRFPNEPKVKLIRSEILSLAGNTEASYALLKEALSSGNISESDVQEIQDSYIELCLADASVCKYFLEIANIIETTYSSNLSLLKSLAISYERLNLNQEHIRVLEKMYELDHSDPEVILEILDHTKTERNWNKCDRISTEALEMYPQNPEIYYFNGLAKYKLKNYQVAQEVLLTGRDLVIDDSKLLSDIQCVLGSVYYKQNIWSEAQLAFDAALIQNPQNVTALNNYAYYMARKNVSLSQALSYIQVAIDLVPNSGIYIDTYGYILFRLKRYDDAEKSLRKAFELIPEDAETAEHLGDCLFFQNKLDEALKYWQIAVQLGANSNTLIQKIENKKYID
jgi:tetratricopeptide (TPR) repeat protein